jgi:hypothetical protein
MSISLVVGLSILLSTMHTNVGSHASIGTAKRDGSNSGSGSTTCVTQGVLEY